MPLGGGFTIPLRRFFDVDLQAADTVFMTPTEMVLCRCTSFLGGLAIPLYRLGEVLFHAIAVFKEHAQIELRRCISLIGGLAIPLDRFFRVLSHSSANFIAPT